MSGRWREIVRLDEAPLRGRTVNLAPDTAAMANLARELDLLSLSDLKAKLFMTLWFDGVEIVGDWSAEVVQACIVTLEPLASKLEGTFKIRIVPRGSKLAPDETTLGVVDPEGDDPPDVSDDGEIDLAGYVIEYLSLEIDPYPRKEGATFEPPQTSAELSPFAVLKAFKPKET